MHFILFFSSEEILKLYFKRFCERIEFFCRRLLVIDHILNIKYRLELAKEFYRICHKNSVNWRNIVTQENATEILQRSFTNLKYFIEVSSLKPLRLADRIKHMSELPCQNVHEKYPPPLSDTESDDETSSQAQENEGSSQSHFLSEQYSTTRMDYIAQLETNTEETESQLVTIQSKKDHIKVENRESRQQHIIFIMKVIAFENEIQNVEGIIADKLHHFQSHIIDLESKRMEIYKNFGDLSVRRALEAEIEDVKENFKAQLKVDETGRDELIQQAQKIAASIVGLDVVKEYQVHIDESMTGMKCNRLLMQKFNNNMMQLKRLIYRSAQFCKDVSGSRFYLNCNRPLHNDDEGEFFIDIRERKIYTKYYFDDEFGRFFIDVSGNRVYKVDPEASEHMLVNEKDEHDIQIKPLESEVQTEILSNQDFKYINETVGVAIRKALAAVVLHQPADPINYFGNFLRQYRYNEQMFEHHESELEEFVELHHQINCTLNYAFISAQFSQSSQDKTKPLGILSSK